MAKLLKYKGILFDNWEEQVDDDGNKMCWAEMCDKHAEKYRDILKNELSDGGMGACSVSGCDRVGADCRDAECWYYMDFDVELIEFVESE